MTALCHIQNYFSNKNIRERLMDLSRINKSFPGLAGSCSVEKGFEI